MNKISRYLLPVILLIVINPLPSGAAERLKVSASFYPLAHFAGMVGGDSVEVIQIMPAGADPHDFEPTPGDIRNVLRSEVFIYNGAGIDPWAERIITDLQKRGVLTLEMTGYFDLFMTEKAGKYDPHIWLDPLLVRKEIEIIRDLLIKADPDNNDRYRENSAAYINKLVRLHLKYTEGLKSCKSRSIVVSHNAFSYLAERYNLDNLPISGISTDEEPSPRRMAEISRVVRKKNLGYIFFETLTSQKIAETIAREVGAETLFLNPIEGLTKNEIEGGKSYLSIMETNLKNLRLALSCN